MLRSVHDFPQITATELVEKLVFDKTLLSKNIAVMKRKGLIVRTSSSHDNRLHILP